MIGVRHHAVSACTLQRCSDVDVERCQIYFLYVTTVRRLPRSLHQLRKKQKGHLWAEHTQQDMARGGRCPEVPTVITFSTHSVL